MPSSLPKQIIKLMVALLKHQAELWLGEEAVGIAGETLVEIGGEELQEKVDKLLESNAGILYRTSGKIERGSARMMRMSTDFFEFYPRKSAESASSAFYFEPSRVIVR